MTAYFVMQSALDDSAIDLQDYADHITGFEDWGNGTVAEDRPARAVTIVAVPAADYAGELPDLSDSSVPLMSLRLKRALDAAGIANVTYLPVTVRDARAKRDCEYVAFNLVGLAAALEEASRAGLLMFRHEDNWSVIVVHEQVKAAVTKAGIATVEFVDPASHVEL